MYDKLKSDPHLCSKSVTQYAFHAQKEITTAKIQFLFNFLPQFLAENYFYLTNVLILKHEKRVRSSTTPPLVAKRR